MSRSDTTASDVSQGSQSTTLLHISDTHLGYRQYRSDTRREDFMTAFSQAIGKAISRDVSAVVHTGDLFDMRNPPNTVLMNCITQLRRLADADIPFYGIVGNHERKQDVQHLDLIHEAGVAERLSDEPTLVNDHIALYGIDSVPKPSWDAREFALADPPADTFVLVTMHELLKPPLPEIEADHNLTDVLDRLSVTPDAIALGDDHTPRSDRVQGVDVWYPGSTERTASDQTEQRSVQLLKIEGKNLTRRTIPLDTRSFHQLTIQFDEGDTLAYVADELARHTFNDGVVQITLTGEPTPTSSREVRQEALQRGAAVCQVYDQRGGPEIDTTEGPSGSLESIGRRIEVHIDELELDQVVTTLESKLRAGETRADADQLQARMEDTLDEQRDDILVQEQEVNK